MSSACCQELPEIFKWNDLIKTGGFCFAVNVLLISMLATDTGIIYTASNLSLLTILATIGFLFVMKYFLGHKEVDNDEFIAVEFVSQETIQGYVISLVSLVNSLKTSFTNLHKSSTDQIKTIVTLFVAAKLLNCFSLSLLVLLVVNAILLYGFVTRKLQINLCELAHPYIVQAKELSSSLLTHIPKYQQPAESK